jgi:hypothetical protein
VEKRFKATFRTDFGTKERLATPEGISGQRIAVSLADQFRNPGLGTAGRIWLSSRC